MSEIDELPEDLPELTHKQMTWVTEVHNGSTDADAYRKAYNCENSTANTIYVECWHLRQNPKISQWLRVLQETAFKQASYTKDRHIKHLLRLSDKAENTGNIGAAVLAATNAGKSAGHHTDKVEVSVGDQDLPTIYAKLKRTLGEDQADAVFAQRGWSVPTTSSDTPVH